MKKIFFLLLATTFFISCSNDDQVEPITDEVSTLELVKYENLFKKYESFKVDGKTIHEQSEIIELLQNSAVTDYNQKNKEVNFYTSLDKLAELTGANITEITKDTTPDEESMKSSETNITGKSSLLGIPGLGTIANNSYFTNFSNNVFFTAKYSNRTYFTKAVTYRCLKCEAYLSNGKNKSLKASGAGVVAESQYVTRFFSKLHQGIVTMNLHNDTENDNMRILFYKRTQYRGQLIMFTLDKDETHSFDRYTFDSYNTTYKYPKSMKVLTNTQYNNL